MKLLAIDPGTRFVGVYDGRVPETFILGGPSPLEQRLAALLSRLQSLDSDFDFVAYEEQFVRGNAATRALYGAVGVIQAVAAAKGAGVLAVPQSTVRKWVSVAKGETTKDAYRRHAERLGYTTPGLTQDEIDAIVIWHFVKENGVLS